MAKRIIRKKETLGNTGLSSSSLYEKVASGEFPAPVQIGVRSVGWIEAEVDEWIKTRKRVTWAPPVSAGEK